MFIYNTYCKIEVVRKEKRDREIEREKERKTKLLKYLR